MLMVSYCGQSMSVVHRPSSVVRRAASTIALKAYSSYTPGPVDSILGRKHRGDVDQKLLKSFRSEIQDGRHGRHLENIFFASSPEPKGQLTPNWLGSIGVTCRSKIAKIVPIGNQDGCHGSHLENLFFASSPEPKGQLTPYLLGSIRVTCRSKIAKVVPIGNPRWPPWQPS